MLAGLIAGCATSIISNPIWVINTRQTVRAPASAAGKAGAKSGAQGKKDVKMGFFQTLSHIVHKDGVLALWRGIGPALVLVINPILQVSGARGGARWGKRGGEGKRRRCGGQASGTAATWRAADREQRGREQQGREQRGRAHWPQSRVSMRVSPSHDPLLLSSSRMTFLTCLLLQYTAFEQLKNALVKARAGRGASVKLSDWDFFLLGALSKLFATGLTYPQIGEFAAAREERERRR
jgi:hypothetical protein